MPPSKYNPHQSTRKDLYCEKVKKEIYHGALDESIHSQMSEYELFKYNEAGWECNVCRSWACGDSCRKQRLLYKESLMYDDRAVRWVQCEKCCKTFHLSCVEITNIATAPFTHRSVFICSVTDEILGKYIML